MTHGTTRRVVLLTSTVSCLLLTACSSATPTASAVNAATSVPTAGPGVVAATTEPIPSRPADNTASAATPTTTTNVPDPTGHVSTTACELITEQEATTALGTDPGPGQETPLGETASACTYLAGTSSLQLSLTPIGGKAVFDRERAGIPTGTTGVTDVSGVGDAAFSQITGTRAAINFDKNDALVVIGLTNTGTPPTQDQLTTLATAAAGRT